MGYCMELGDDETTPGIYHLASWNDTKPTQIPITDDWPHFQTSQSLSRGIPSLPKHLLPFPATFSFPLLAATLASAATHLNALLIGLDIRWQYSTPLATGLGFASTNVWSRSARRHRSRASRNAGQSDDNRGDVTDHHDDDDDEPALGFKISVREVRSQEHDAAIHLSQDQGNNNKNGVDIIVRWVLGNESVLFESFCGMLRREMVGVGRELRWRFYQQRLDNEDQFIISLLLISKSPSHIFIFLFLMSILILVFAFVFLSFLFFASNHPWPSFPLPTSHSTPENRFIQSTFLSSSSSPHPLIPSTPTPKP